MKEKRILQQLDKMVVSGQITEEEAARLRAAEGSDGFEAVVGSIKTRHSEAHMDSAVASGDMTQAEADDYLERLRGGEHPKGLRARLSSHRPRQH